VLVKVSDYPKVLVNLTATALQAENKVNGNVRTEGYRVDTFAEKSGKTTKQAVIPQVGGTVKVMKNKFPDRTEDFFQFYALSET
jgi:hypothetical protein